MPRRRNKPTPSQAHSSLNENDDQKGGLSRRKSQYWFLLLVSMTLAITGYYWIHFSSVAEYDDKSSKSPDITSLNVLDRGLVSTSITATDVINNHNSFCNNTGRNFDGGDVLGYVTPWNSHGYDVAKTFAKFTFISPVWLQILFKGSKKYKVSGLHDADQGWMHAVKQKNPSAKIVPRVLFDGWTSSHFDVLFSSDKELDAMTTTIISTIKDNHMDGIVLEIWSQMPPKKSKQAIHVISYLGDHMKKEDLMFVLVVPPPLNFQFKATSFTKNHFAKLAPVIDAFSLMTYDFGAGSGQISPNAPTSWMEKCVETIDPLGQHRSTILLGLNFYGYSYSAEGSGPIIGNQYIEALSTSKSEFEWREDGVDEHFVTKDLSNNQKAYILYPTLKSIHTRLELAEKLGTGVSIWDIG